MQSVIIYRNPLEAMLWERAMQGAPEILPGMVLALLTFLILYLVGSKIWTKERYTGRVVYTALGVATFVWVGITVWIINAT